MRRMWNSDKLSSSVEIKHFFRNSNLFCSPRHHIQTVAEDLGYESGQK